MRRILAASLLFSPMLFTAAVSASQPAIDASAPTELRSVSTGVTLPTVIHSTNIQFPSDTFREKIPNDAELVLTLSVDEKGNPQNIQVVSPIDKFLDARVVDAVRQFRFTPATLDNQPIPIDMTMDVVLQH
jgi:TonB family protein